MERALKRNDLEFHQAVFKRACELTGEEHNATDPLVSDFYGKTLGSYELVLTEKNGQKTYAARTRQKINNKINSGLSQSDAAVQCLTDWTVGKETDGFKLLIDRGLPELTGEAIVIKHASRFPEGVVQKAKARLAAHGVK
jgi:hypothetical protein